MKATMELTLYNLSWHVKRIHFHWCITVLGLFVQCYFGSPHFWNSRWYKLYLCPSLCASPIYHIYIYCSFPQLSLLCQFFLSMWHSSLVGKPCCKPLRANICKNQAEINKLWKWPSQNCFFSYMLETFMKEN